MTPSQLSQFVKSTAIRTGFDWCGICPAISPTGLNHFHQWLDAGYHGEMQYMENRRQAYSHPKHVMQGVKSIAMLATGYSAQKPAQSSDGLGRVSRYAWGQRDYHDVIHDRLKSIKTELLAELPEINVRGVVDSAPLLEREFASLAGFGWQGKHTLIINKHTGSWFFLAALLLDQEMEYDQPNSTNHCGTCDACLTACPTDAFVQPGLLDATKCISYLTIELREPIPIPLRSKMQDWVFGCDVCQDVCPWNRKATETEELEFHARDDLNPLNLIDLFDLTEDQFRQRFRKTPLWRAKRRGILRNAAIVLGNQKDGSAIAALTKGLHDTEPLIRGASAWALGQLNDDDANVVLRARLTDESDDVVRNEIHTALA